VSLLRGTDEYAVVEREGCAACGYPGYDTSVGLMAYDDAKGASADGAGDQQGLLCIQAEESGRRTIREICVELLCCRECAGERDGDVRREPALGHCRCGTIRVCRRVGKA